MIGDETDTFACDTQEQYEKKLHWVLQSLMTRNYWLLPVSSESFRSDETQCCTVQHI